jgi:APA family basic amino acid/polyamine antiporter
MRRKPMVQQPLHDPVYGGGPSLRRALTVWGLLFYGIGSTIGSGVFVLTGEVISEYAGPATVFSFLIAGVACMLSCFCYCEFACRVPFAGSAYTYSYVSLGELAAWIVGWDLTLEYAIGSASVARGFGSYFAEMISDIFSYDIPEWLYDWGDNSFSPLAAALVAVLAVLVLSMLILIIGVILLLMVFLEC